MRAWATAALLCAVTILTRLPFMTPRLAHWDAVNYALGLHDFDIAAHQPHPPGSPYYILLGRAVLAFVNDDNVALIAVSLAASCLAVLAVFALATTLLRNTPAAFIAGLLLATHPIFWGYGTMATPWTLLALLAILIALSSAHLLRGNRQLVLPSAVLMAVASGFRLDASVFLAPLWLYSLARAEPRLDRRLAALAVVALGVVVWLIPVVATSGGLTAWFERLLALFAPSATSEQSLIRQFASNSAVTLVTLALGIGGATLLALSISARTTFASLSSLPRSELGRVVLLWSVPPLLFLWLVDSTEPGHALVFAGACAVLSASLMTRAIARTSRLAICTAVLVVCQIGAFLVLAPRADKPPPWALNSAILNVTAPGLRAQQDSLDASLEAIQRDFDPVDSVILTVTGQNVYRFMMYYLPAYQVLQLDPTTHTILAARERQQGHWQEPPDCLSSSVRHAILVVWTNSEPGIVPETARPIAGGGNGPFQSWMLELGPGAPEYLGFQLGGC